MAASGGYHDRACGRRNHRRPSSIVGSIGVVSASFGFPELLKKIGVERRVYTAGSNKVTLDPFQPEKAEDIERLKALQLEIHATFIDMVKERRAGKLGDNPDLFQRPVLDRHHRRLARPHRRAWRHAQFSAQDLWRQGETEAHPAATRPSGPQAARHRHGFRQCRASANRRPSWRRAALCRGRKAIWARYGL
ncbi:S49 family peptidase [Brucella abortus]|nr:S49 family peptidase [Brucella abortus]